MPAAAADSAPADTAAEVAVPPAPPALYVGRVLHLRLRPRRHRLSYRVFSLLIDLDDLARARRGSGLAGLRLLSRDRFNLASLRDRDYGDGSGTPLKAQVEAHLLAAGLEPDGGAVTLLTMPRILGYGFNPLNVYFCHRRDGRLAAILYEVNNTFGQRHSYLAAVDPDAAPGAPIRQSAEKCFYVSPFMDMALSYGFRVLPPAERLVISIAVRDGEGLLLSAVHEARRERLTDRALMWASLVCPLLTVKVIAAIHWEALLIWAKGIGLRARPAPPGHAVSVSPAHRS
ncbi:DUF1365 domain-containing protein [Ancylobacter lacus]|uniref:DUF1365 domain-containing protein n=1 Tax=Ancylobacter lacus TaxID=2579970 RepID=UPI001BCAA25A|nr:DUF1365 family protein [Ancylobacter lacus]MBS7539503.1 DUF1365 domain-containing protein [Ancylobacter lacus]